MIRPIHVFYYTESQRHLLLFSTFFRLRMFALMSDAVYRSRRLSSSY